MIMNKLSAAVAALALAALAPNVSAQNLLANPGFEGSLAGWGVFGNSFFEAANPPAVSPRNGGGILKMFGNFSGSFNVSGVFQAFPASAGQQFTLDCWTRHFSGDAMVGTGLPANNWVVMKIAFFNAGGTEIGNAEQVVLDGNSVTDVWIDNPAVTGTAPVGTSSVQALLLYLQPAFAGGAAQFDDVTFTTPPQVPSYPGTNEDVRLATGINGAIATYGTGQDIKTAQAGQLMEFKVSSPNNTYTLKWYYLLGTVTASGAVPPPQLPFLNIWVDLNTYFIMAGALTPLGPPLIGPNGSSNYFIAPAGLPGVSVVAQAICIGPTAANGIYAASDAHEIRFQ
jgi:hypothetical protein